MYRDTSHRCIVTERKLGTITFVFLFRKVAKITSFFTKDLPILIVVLKVA